MKFFRKNNSGFTLIELLLYVAISAIILLISSLFLSILLEARVKNQTIAELEQQGLQVMQIITQTIRNAQIINSPTSGSSSNSLSLGTMLASTSPSVFDLSGGVIRIKEGNNIPIPLTNSKVSVTNLLFNNFSRVGTPGIVGVSFTLNMINNSNRHEYSFTKDFKSAAALR